MSVDAERSDHNDNDHNDNTVPATHADRAPIATKNAMVQPMTNRELHLRVRRLIAVCALVFPTALTSCSHTRRSIQSTAPQTNPAASLGLPDPEKLRSEQLALNVELARCMRKEGFAFYDSDPGPIDYGGYTPMLDDDAAKRRGGYGVSDSLNPAPQIIAQTQAPIPASQRDSVRFRETNDACLKKLAPAFPVLAAALSYTEPQVSAAALAPTVEADARMKPLRKRWRTCMLERGYRLESPWAAGAMIRSKGETIANSAYDDKTKKAAIKKYARLRKLEMRIANADADCSQAIAADRDQIWAEYITSARNGKIDENDPVSGEDQL